MSEYITHPLIKEKTVERRAYQLSIAATALMHNTLVILPTGLGKTAIALLVIASRLLNEEGKALVLAPTKPLVEQHAKFFRKTLKIEESKIVAFSGEVSPGKRKDIWKDAKLIVSTPQVIENDLIAERINLNNVVHITFDEAHRAVGDYAYVYIADLYFKQAKKPLVLGMTASPGSDIERIKEVIRNLHIEAIEIRTENDEDVKPYIHGKKIEWIKVEMPKEIKEIKEIFEKILNIRIKKLKKLGIDVEGLSKKELLALQESLQTQAAEKGDEEVFEAISVLAEILKIQHGIELIETQGVEALKNYLKRLLNEAKSRGGSKAAKSIISDPIFRELLVKVSLCRTEHPKIRKLKEIVEKQISENPNSRIIVFTNYRDTAELIQKELSKIVPAAKFVGQAKRFDKKGMSQKEQIETLEKFRTGEIKVLIATSVGEEGLDIPSTDLVVFYEAVPSEIRAIQRKGRTGRTEEGRIVVLITKGTRDEAYYWASVRKEKAMYAKLYELREELMKNLQKNWFLYECDNSIDNNSNKKYTRAEEDKKIDSGLIVYVDSRESKSGIAKKLKEKGVNVVIKNLSIADYVISDRVAIERKSVEDFTNSVLSNERNVFTQIAKLKSKYSRPILIIEGKNIYKTNPSVIRGAIAAIAVDFGVPMIWTKSPEDTAEYITLIAKREQKLKKRVPVYHDGKTKKSLKEVQEYVVSSLSDVGAVTARNLLEHFQTVEKVVTASEDELIKVPNVGKKIAKKIRRVVTTPYNIADKVEFDKYNGRG